MDTTDLHSDLRIALRRLAKAVVIVTCRFEGNRFAMAATAVSELSMDPPSMLVCVNQSASIYLPMLATDQFAINILHRSQRHISECCSGPIKSEARFGVGHWCEENPDCPPILVDAQANIICRKQQHVQFGSHGVFFGAVTAATTHGEVAPLIYVDGCYTCDPVMAPESNPKL
ncbi:MAG: flavin reductase family protein [Dehalococcoidia bacterium]